MATEQSPPRIRLILTIAFSSVVILGALNSVFRSYFLMMTEQVEHDHLSKPVELEKLREGEKRNLTTSPLPIAQAMMQVAQRGRAGGNSALADITPQASNDLGPMVGWVRNPNQAVVDKINQMAANPAPEPAAVGDGGVAAATSDAGPKPAAAANDAGKAH
jgi:hypothetical protein